MSDTIFQWLFWLSNESIDLTINRDDREDDGHIRFDLTLALPLRLRRLRCSHKGARRKGGRWCFRCERQI